MSRILIIEDDSLVSSIYRNIYEKVGHEVAIAADGEKGLQRIDEFRPDLVQLDLMVPKVNGVEVIKRIRLKAELKSLPIIVLSGCCHDDTVQQAIKAGANQVLAKRSCSPKVALEAVNEHLCARVIPTAALTLAAHPVPAGESPRTPTPPQASHSSLHQEFLDRAPEIQSEVSSCFRALAKNANQMPEAADLQPLTKAVHSLSGYAGISGYARISVLAGAIEEFLKQLQSKPKQISPSTMRTIAKAIDCLGHLFVTGPQTEEEFSQSALILAVDDEPIARQTLCASLNRVKLKTISLDNPQLALQVLEQNKFDLIFLDVEMPEMDGFELCKKLHAFPSNATTPVVFVTSHSDFTTNARSALAGGNDLIAKPFLMMELALKALAVIVNASKPSAQKTLTPVPSSGMTIIPR